jgi:hypothetical protein
MEEIFEAIAEALRFHGFSEDFEDIESNCGSVWFKNGEKTYSIAINECEHPNK